MGNVIPSGRLPVPDGQASRLNGRGGLGGVDEAGERVQHKVHVLAYSGP